MDESISKNIEGKKNDDSTFVVEDSCRIAKECDNIIAEMRACAPVVLAIYARIRERLRYNQKFLTSFA